MIYSTHDVHPRERLSYWREVATRGYVEHELRPDDRNSFRGTMHIATLPGLGLATYSVEPALVVRSERAAARTDCGDLLLCMQYGGEIGIAQDGRESAIEGRGMYLIDPIRPFELQIKAHCATTVVKVPRSMLEARIGTTANLTARPISPTNGVGALAMGFLELLPEQAEFLDDVAGLKVANQMLDLTALAFTSGLGTDAAMSSPRAVALLRLKATIERLLIEPSLKPERVAAEAGISVRYANALLAEENWSIERYLGERRLERCRSALEDTAQAHRSIGEIAFKWGFSDLSHFGRRFKARYGMTPTEYRQAGRQESERRLSEAPDQVKPALDVRTIREVA